MIDDEDHALLEGGSSCVAGFVGADGAPFAIRAWAITLLGGEPPRARVVISADPRLDATLIGGWMSVTATDVPTLVSRQLKGPIDTVRVPDDSDLDAMTVRSEAFLQAVHETDRTPMSLLRRMLPVDVLVMEMTVREVYDQTPGPAAGVRVGRVAT